MRRVSETKPAVGSWRKKPAVGSWIQNPQLEAGDKACSLKPKTKPAVGIWR